MTNTDDLREVAACTYFRARRMARLVTRFYDNQLGSVGINTNQLGLLAKLLDASMLGVSDCRSVLSRSELECIPRR